MRMGGEASLPFYYAKAFARRGAEVWLACHERVEAELRETFPEIVPRLRAVKDTPTQKFLFRLGTFLPSRIRDIVIAQFIHFLTQYRVRTIAIDLARRAQIDIVFEPAPITPKGLSFMYNVGVPVVIGPMCGGMNFPPAFADLDSRLSRMMIAVGRYLSHAANRLVPGKLRADILLTANAGTVKALPMHYRGRVIQLFESGVDLTMWTPPDRPMARPDGTVRFVFSGRFVDWKGIQYLMPAFAKAASQEPRCRLDLIGGGEFEGTVRSQIEQSRLHDLVRVHGWLSRPEAAQIVRAADVFVMPSLRECGGTAILEAMALGKPVITTNWGGPADYVDAGCGILVDPRSKSAFVDGLADAMIRLARSTELRAQLGAGGTRRVRRDYLDWESKAERVLEILTDTARPASTPVT